MKPKLLSILAGLALIASACGPAAQPPGGPTGPGNVTVATPQAAGGATPAAAQTAATTAAAKPTTAVAPAATVQPTTAARPAAQPSGPQEITINALQGEPDN